MDNKNFAMPWIITAFIGLVFGVVLIVTITNEPETAVGAASGTGVEGLQTFGTGKVSATPDQAQVTVGVETRDESPVEAQAGNAAVANKILGALSGLGVADKDIQTINVSLNPEFSFDETGGSRVIGYVASNTLEITLKNLDNVGAAIDAAVQAGGTTVNSIFFSFSDEAQARLEDQARRLATQDALRRATVLAQLSGVRLGEPITISESTSGPVPPPIFFGGGDLLSAAESTPVEAGSLEVSVDVSITYEID